jgi:hypothetical protein
MCFYQALNIRLENEIRDCYRSRLLVYALDTKCLSDQAYNGFPGFITTLGVDGLEALTQYAHVTRLYWIRAFFEYGRGNDPWQVLRDQFEKVPSIGKATYPQLKELAEALGITANIIPGGKPRDSFLVESWLVGGNLDPNQVGGTTSRIWKYLMPLIRRLNTQAENLGDVMQQLDGDGIPVPSHVQWLVDQRDPDFVHSLIALRVTHGVGWLTRIARLRQNLQDYPDLNAAWMLYVNGNLRRVDLVISNIYFPANGRGTLEVRQKNRVIARRDDVSNGGKFHIELAELNREGMDDSEKLVVTLNDKTVEIVSSLATVFPPNQPVLFRYPEQAAGRWLPVVLNGEHIFAHRVVVMVGNALTAPAFTFLNRPIENQYIQDMGNVKLSARATRTLFEVTLPRVETPASLMVHGVLLAIVGSKPAIEVDNVFSGIRSLDMEAAVVVEGYRADLQVINIPAAVPPPPWICEDGRIEANGNGRVSVFGLPYGQRCIVRCGEARRSLIALPCGVFDGAVEGWSWRPQDDFTCLANGEEAGTLTGPNECSLRLSRPLGRIAWWWQSGAVGQPEGIGIPKDFDGYAEMASRRLLVWVPFGMSVKLSFGPQELGLGGGSDLATLSGGQRYEFRLGDLLQNDLRIEDIGNVIDVLSLDNVRVANVLRVPSTPVLFTINGTLRVFFPATHYPAQYSIVCLYETGIKLNQVEVISCKDLRTQQMQNINLTHQRVGDEGVWAALAEGNPGTGLYDVCQDDVQVVNAVALHIPGPRRVRDRLGVTNDAETNTARGILDWFAQMAKRWEQYGVFSEAVADRSLLQYPNRPDFWSNYYKDHCQVRDPENPQRDRMRRIVPQAPLAPVPLEVALSLMLRVGFNWCAEPNWLTWAYEQIPIAMNWSRIPTRRRRHLNDQLNILCPPMLAQHNIESEFLPRCDFDRALLTPMGIIGIRCPDLQNGQAYTEGNEIQAIRANDKSILFVNEGREWNRKTKLEYHKANLVETPFVREPQRFVGWMPRKRETEYVRFMLDGENLKDNDLLSTAEREQLQNAFCLALNVAEAVVGGKHDRGLYLMFTLAANGFRDWEDRSNRLVIFQAAVLCRLHAWLGWREPASTNDPVYPGNWPMSEQGNYDLVCRIVRAAWHDTDMRKVLINDLIPVEWMLAWFHN